MTLVYERLGMDVPDLTSREIEVMRTWLLCETKAQAAAELFISQSTVNTHITRIRDKYYNSGRPARTKAAMLARALQDGLITIEELG